MSEEEIADRASRLAQTPQEMQAWMAAMTGSRGPLASTDTWQQRDANRRTIADQQETYRAMGFEGSMGAPQTDFSEEQIAQFREADPFTLSPSQLQAAGMTENGILKREYRTKANLDQLSPAMQRIMGWVDRTAPDSEGAAPSIGTTGKTTPGSQVPLVTGPEDRSRLDRTVPSPARAQVEPTTTYEAGDPVDSGRGSTRRAAGIPVANLSDIGKAIGGALGALGPLPTQFGGGRSRTADDTPVEPTAAAIQDISEEQALLQAEPDPSGMDWRGMGTFPQYQQEQVYGAEIPRSFSEEQQMLLDEPDPRGIDFRGLGTFPQYQMEQQYAPPPTAPDRSRLMMEDPRDPTAYMSGGDATEAYRARLQREAQDQLAGDRSRFELLPSETSTGMLNPEVWSRAMARRKAQEDIPREVVAEDRSRMEPIALRSSLGMLDPDAASVDYARRLAQQDMIAAGLRDEPVLDEEQQMLLDEPTARGLRGLGTFPSYQMAQQYGDMRPPETDRPFRGSRSSLGMIDPSITREQARLMAQQDIPSDWHTTGRQDTRPFTGAVSPLGMLDPSKIGLEQAQAIARESAREQFPSPPPSTAMTGTVATQPILDPIEDIGAMPRRAEDILAAPGAAALYERGLGRLAISPRELEFLDTSLVDIDERKTNKKPIGSFQYGGSVPKTGPYQLHEGEFVFNQNPYEDLGTDIFASDYERRRKNRAGSWGIPSSGSAMPSSPTASMVGPDRSRFNVDTTVNPVYGDEPIQDQFAATQAQRDEERAARREERRKRMAEGRQRQLNEAAAAPRGVSGGGAFFAGSQIIPYASTADRLKALQRSGLSRSQAAGFDQAEREKSMARQQRFVRRGGKRRTYG